MKRWLFKSEPNEFSIWDLQKCKNQTEPWDGVRNYQARNFMMKECQIGDPIFFYHSNAKPPGIIGIAEVASKPYADFTQFDKKDKHYDPKSDPENPRWFLVDVKFVKEFKNVLSLNELRDIKSLEGMVLLRKGSRLSIQPVSDKEWGIIENLAVSK